MRNILVAFVLAASLPAYAEAPPHTLRVDYYHSGNRDEELFSLDRVVLEPLPFPGNPARAAAPLRRGKYLFEVHAADGGALLYAQSYSSIYGEWETTGEARRMNRTFHESLRFPTPSQPVDITVFKRNAHQAFDPAWQVSVDPGDYLVYREAAAYEDQVVSIEYNGDPSSRVDLLLLGDGYMADEHDAFIARVRQLVEMLFKTPPFRERREDFNIWALAPPSAESGITRPSTGRYRDTPFGTRYDAFRSERYVLSYDNRRMRRIISSAPYDVIEILANSEVYGGAGIFGLYSTAAANSEWVNYLFVHEFGHHFAGLADEYYTSSVMYEAPPDRIEPYQPNVTVETDRDRLKWRDRLNGATPLPTPWPKTAYDAHSLELQERRKRMREANVAEAEMNRLFRDEQAFVEGLFSTARYRDTIGAFEGANYQARGYYRPAMNCLMFTRTESFCAVCADAIEQAIDLYSRPLP